MLEATRRIDMSEIIVNLIIAFNLILLLGIVIGLRRWHKAGKLTETRLALILTGYFSFSVVTTSLPILSINILVTAVVDLVFLLVLWSIGYPWIRWLYRQFNSSK